MKSARADEKMESSKEEKELSKWEEEMLAIASKCLRTAKIYSLLKN